MLNPKILIDKAIREKAIANAKDRLMQHGKTPDEAGEMFEVIVGEEEAKIKSDLKDKSIAGMILALGIQVLAG